MVIAGQPMGYEDLAVLPLLVGEAGGQGDLPHGGGRQHRLPGQAVVGQPWFHRGVDVARPEAGLGPLAEAEQRVVLDRGDGLPGIHGQGLVRPEQGDGTLRVGGLGRVRRERTRRGVVHGGARCRGKVEGSVHGGS